MISSPRMNASLEKLLKLAKSTADEQRVDLADIERAKDTAQKALARIENAVATEETKAQRDEVAFVDFLEGARTRRQNLQTTLLTLEDAEAEAKNRLETAFIEIKKLEHLMAIGERQQKGDARARDQRDMDEIGAVKFSRG